MTLPQSVTEVLRDHVRFECESIDRMYLNVYVPQLQSVGGVVWYLRRHRIEVVSFQKGHAERNHQGIENRIIQPSNIVAFTDTPIQCRDRLGGMLKYYYREAA